MKFRVIFLICFILVLFSACEKNTVSKIPHIALIGQGLFPLDSMYVGDTAAIQFSLVDGDGDIGYSDPNDPGVSQVYINDKRFDTGYARNPFPGIDVTIEDPKKGLQGICLVLQFPLPRLDSLHTATGDTLTYELYIKDRAGNESNHLVTHALIIRP